MDVRAIILVGGRSLPVLASGNTTTLAVEGQHRTGALPERVCGLPIGMLDVLGEPVVQRVLARLEHVGVSDACIVTEAAPANAPMARGSIRPDMKWLHGTGAQFWRCAETAFSELAQAGAEVVIVVRVGAYAEIDYEDLIQFHLDKGQRVTCAVDPDGVPLDTLVITSSRRNDAAFLLRHQLKQFRAACAEYRYDGYVNRLESAADLRRLTLDCFAKVVSFSPAGREIKPGVWAAEGVRVHRTARVLAPAFIGAHTRVRALSVVTRGSVIEHHSEIDCGSVLENSTVLPFSYIGPGLDVSHSVVGNRHIANLKKSVEVEISERRFVGMTRVNPSVRTLTNAVSLATFLPKQIVSGFLKGSGRKAPASLPQAINSPAAALKTPALKENHPNNQEGEFSANLAVARRYGNE